MVRLGLQPPYTEEDVAEAYRSRVMVVHPDRGGNSRDFIELQAAFERAEQYVHFRRNRRAD
jgi:curved DNA-binding protein CbpA